jgi:glycosyltransferase involved in cell wall biosynthesis
MQISVVIPTKNRHDDLMIALRSIAVQSKPPNELVIIDQSAEEIDIARWNSVEQQFAGRSSVRWIHDRSISGLVEAKREGANRAAGEIICFLEDDIVLEREYLESIADAFVGNPALIGV